MIQLKLPTWLNNKVIVTLKVAAQSFWEKVEHWLTWPLRQMDAETCSLGVLDLIAWQRDITRFAGEPEWLYRRRVMFAVINARDAGSTIGLIRIFARLEIGNLTVEERLPDRDWDVVLLKISDFQLSENSQLLNVLLAMYGRTCRRYELTTQTFMPLQIRSAIFDNDHLTVLAR